MATTEVGQHAEQPTALPLAGIRVLELTHVIAGPAAGLMFAELGADVIRVDPIGRPGIGFSGWAAYSDRNKRSIQLDLKQPEAQEVFLRLVKTTDVVLDNFAPGAIERLGADYETLSAHNPGLIFLSIKGFVPGPYENRTLLDEAAQMMGGLAFMTGPPGMPLRAGAPVIDLGAAFGGVIGVLAALIDRQRTGRGQKITSGLFETSAFLVAQHMVAAAVTGTPCVTMAAVGQGARMRADIYQLFRTKDERQVFVGVVSTAHWRRLCEEFAVDDMVANRALNEMKAGVETKSWLEPLLAELFATFTSEELQAKLDRAQVPYAPLARPDELFDDPHLLGSGQIIDTPVPGVGMVKLPKLPFASSAYKMPVVRPAPGHGEHTHEVLTSLGYGEAELRDLAANGAIRFGVSAAEEAAAPLS